MKKRDYISGMVRVNKKMKLITETVEFFKIQIEEEIKKCEETEKNPKSLSFEKKMKEHRFKMGLILNKLYLEEEELVTLEKSVKKLNKKYKNLL